MNEFVHLHVHSDFSLQDAAVTVQSLADRAEELGMKYLALTDHGNMFGVMDFLAACKETAGEDGKHVRRKNPIHPIIGCEVYVASGSRFNKKYTQDKSKYFHLVLLASSRQGYFNLVKLCSCAYTEGFYTRPRVDDELLQEYHEGLIALSACVAGEIPRLIGEGKTAEAEDKARFYRDLFGEDNFYLEIQDHGIPADILKGSLSQREINEVIAGISRRTGIPLVATNDVHYLKQEDAIAHDILLCIGTAQLRGDEKRKKKYFGDQFYLKNGDEMAALFPGYPEAIANTVKIAERCVTDIPAIDVKDLPKFLPEFEIPPDFAGADAYLRHLAMEGLKKRYPGMNETAVKRAEYELDVIIQMGFTGYFLIVEDFINWAKAQGISVGPGRGSGAGSIVAYALRITDIDPLKYDLLFERFLNPERISMPDFDVDFCNERREEVIRYVTGKYGKERVGQIITFGTLKSKAVIKDVARVLGISIPESEMITKLIPGDPKITLAKAFEGEPKLRDLEKDPRYTELFFLARKLEGLHRHASIHAAGVVIGKSALDNYVPLYRDPKTGGVATQYTKDHLEQCGLVKMDFLGLKTLDVIKHTEELIRRRGGRYAAFSIEEISESGTPEAGAVFKMLGEGKSFEVFQFESEGMQNILRQAEPGTIGDLIALNALYRPGPMDNISQYIESKHGRRAVAYPDPCLESILKETYGVIVYQEQVMQVAQRIAGFTLGHADELRRAMGKKNMEKMVKEKEQFISGAVERGFKRELADKIFEILVPFAGYGFNKSHAAAYSVVAYQTAYLKANFPAEFMAANLSNEINSTDKDKLSACIDESRKMGLVIDPPDINRSDKVFSVVEGRIVYGFLGIKGLGEASAEEIINCRKEGPYRDFMDFLNRVDIKAVGKKVIELLILTGSFDRFGISRAVLQGNLERAVEYAQNIKDDSKYGQASLFGEAEEQEYSAFEFEAFPEKSREERLTIEKELIGFYFSGHPMDDYKELWRRLVKLDLGRPESFAPGRYMLMGVIKTIRTHVSGRGGKMAFVSLADYRGEIDVTFFAGPWEKCQDKIAAGRIAILRGRLEYQPDKDRRSFLAEECFSPEEAEAALERDAAFFKQMDAYRNIWEGEVRVNLSRPEETDPKEEYTLIGILKDLRPFHTQKGNDMAYASLSDYNGEIGVTIFPKPWSELKDKLRDGALTALRGKIKNDSFKNKFAFYAEAMLHLDGLKGSYENRETALIKGAASPEPPEAGQSTAPPPRTAPAAPCREIHIQLKAAAAEQDETLYPLRDLLLNAAAEGAGSCPVFIHVTGLGEETVIRAAPRISLPAGAADIDTLRRCAGVAEAWSRP
ncbi:MAG: DNA polymerase III subunit alpha [Treponema sp.]|jgi:DNA polymerase-3 subunit alpha|nr:DNA polymerase III subunit alpha [Treponema sp.]